MFNPKFDVDQVSQEKQDLIHCVRSCIKDRTDYSFAKAYTLLEPNTIKIIESKKGYYFDQTTNLWKEGSVEEIYYVIVFDTLNEFIMDMYKRIEYHMSQLDSTSDDYQSQLDIWKENEKLYARSHEYIKNASSIKKISSFLYKLCGDKQFPDKLNSDPVTLPIMNKSKINLLTGEISARTKYDYFTFEAPVDPSIQVTDSLKVEVNDFMLALANNDPDLCKYLQTLLLYFLTGLTFDRSVYQILGRGRNGKSTFTRIIEELLGEVCIIGSRKFFVYDRRNPNLDGPQPDLIHMKGKRVIMVHETRADDYINSASVKMITGGDTISARNLYSDKILKFKVIGKILFSTNFSLSFSSEDEGFQDRLKSVPFNNRFEKNEKVMKRVLETDFLTALLQTCISVAGGTLSNSKIEIPAVVTESTKEIISEQDNVNDFIEEYYEFGNNYKIKCNDVFSDFVNYCRMYGVEDTLAKNRNSFYKTLTQKGFKKQRSTGNRYYFFGLRKRQDESITNESDTTQGVPL